MKKTLIGLMVIVLLVLGCKGPSRQSQTAKNRFDIPLTQISGDVVYDRDGNETAINGEVCIQNYLGLTIFPPLMKLGTIEQGKLNLEFQEYSGDSRRLREIDVKVPAIFSDIKIEPPDTQWIRLDTPYPIIIYSDEEVKGFFGRKAKQAYRLNLNGNPSDVTIQLVYFTNDVTIRAKGDFQELLEWDIDIQGRKGWNILYETESETKLLMTTSEKGITDIKWVATAAGSF
jgi:hypothetical protein